MGATLLILTILIPWGGALLVWWIGDTHPKFQHRLAVIAALGAGICALRLLGFSGTSATVVFPVGGPFGDFTFVPDGLGVFLAAVATVIGSLAVIFSVDYMKGEHQLGRYYAFVLFFIGAMVGLVLTSNILLMFVFWEITALCSYALISFHNDDPKAVAGGMKALIMTQLGGVGLLAGIPPLNGFWSKELVLEAGFTGPYNGSYYFMLLGAGLTALYTARMVWMVFFGEARSSLHAHDAGTAMKVALIPLALGTLSTWLLAGSFSDLLKNSLPFHEIEAVTLGGLVQKIFSDPLTYTALLVVAVGIVCWFQRQRLQGLVDGFSSFSKAAQNSFGFEAINRAVVKVTQDGAEALRPSQTGVLAWNVAGILAALIIVLLILIARV